MRTPHTPLTTELKPSHAHAELSAGRDPTGAPVEHGFQREEYHAGSTIFREGQAGTYAYVIEGGVVEISVRRTGESHVIATLGEGDLFGEMALVDDDVRSATATAVEDVELVSISRQHVENKLRNGDPILELFLKVIVRRSRSLLRSSPESEGLHPHKREATTAIRNSGEDTARERAITQIRCAEALQRGIHRRELRVFYQPIVCLDGGYTAGLEALVRWQHPTRGLMPPSEFIGVAEETGLIGQIGLWVLEQACTDLGHFQDRFSRYFPDVPPLFISVNLSAEQLHAPGEVERIARVVKATETDPAQVKLEITETLLIEEPEMASNTLGQLKALGVGVAIDDFGTGYASLSYLHRLPVDTLKIDRSFVHTMLRHGGSLRIVRAVTQLARALGMDAVAEGIEEREALTRLREFGCTHAQGHLISRPVSAREIFGLLSERIRW